MKTKKTKSDSKLVSVGALAEKYGCSGAYVSKVLKNGGGSTVLAQKIKKDAADMIAVLERETTITV